MKERQARATGAPTSSAGSFGWQSAGHVHNPFTDGRLGAQETRRRRGSTPPRPSSAARLRPRDVQDEKGSSRPPEGTEGARGCRCGGGPDAPNGPAVTVGRSRKRWMPRSVAVGEQRPGSTVFTATRAASGAGAVPPSRVNTAPELPPGRTGALRAQLADLTPGKAPTSWAISRYKARACSGSYPWASGSTDSTRRSSVLKPKSIAPGVPAALHGKGPRRPAAAWKRPPGPRPARSAWPTNWPRWRSNWPNSIREEHRLLDAYQAGLVDIDQLRQRQGRLRQRRAHVNGSIEVLHTERKTAQQQAQLQADLETFVDRIRGTLATLDFRRPATARPNRARARDGRGRTCRHPLRHPSAGAAARHHQPLGVSTFPVAFQRYSLKAGAIAGGRPSSASRSATASIRTVMARRDDRDPHVVNETGSTAVPENVTS